MLDAAFRKAFGERRGGSQSALQNEGYAWWKGLVFDVLQSLHVATTKPDEMFHELYWRFADVDVWRLFPDAMPALLEARVRGLKIALISNWDVRLRRLIEGMGIMSLFDAMVISTEAGFEKPDPRIYQIACERLAVQPSQALHIGDSEREDVEGARGAGVGALLVDRKASGQSNAQSITDLRQWVSVNVETTTRSRPLRE